MRQALGHVEQSEWLARKRRIDPQLWALGWEAIPELAAEWNDWTPYERSDFALEWPIREDRLAQLGQHAEAGLLTPAQRRCYEKLLALVARHRPELERLFRGYRP